MSTSSSTTNMVIGFIGDLHRLIRRGRAVCSDFTLFSNYLRSVTRRTSSPKRLWQWTLSPQNQIRQPLPQVNADFLHHDRGQNEPRVALARYHSMEQQATYGELRELLKQAKRWRFNAAQTEDRLYSEMFLRTALVLERRASDRAGTRGDLNVALVGLFFFEAKGAQAQSVGVARGAGQGCGLLGRIDGFSGEMLFGIQARGIFRVLHGFLWVTGGHPFGMAAHNERLF